MSITQQLLSVPEIYCGRIERSVVFHALTEQEQQIIVNAASEEDQYALACKYGDQSDVVRNIYRMEIEEPAIREGIGIPFPSCANIEESFFFRCVDKETQELVKNAPDELEKRMIIIRYLETP